MSRILFLVVLLAVGYLLLKSWQRKNIASKNKGFGQLRKKSTMVRCEHCALHVPEPDAVKHRGKYFCSLEHAQQARLTRDDQNP